MMLCVVFCVVMRIYQGRTRAEREKKGRKKTPHSNRNPAETHFSSLRLSDTHIYTSTRPQWMHKHDVVSLSELSRGQAAVVLMRTILQRGVVEQAAPRVELDVAMSKVVRGSGLQ